MPILRLTYFISNGAYKQSQLQLTTFEFPITNKGIIHFEKNNKDFSINIFEIDADGDKIIGPTFRTLGINNVIQESMHYAYITIVKRLC